MASSSSLPPRPKPWETSSPANTSNPARSSAFDNAIASSSSNTAPAVPDRPSDLLTSGINGTYANQSALQPRYGSYGLNGINTYGGAYGGYGGAYGGYGGYAGGLGGLGMNRLGAYGGFGGVGGYGMGGVPGYPGASGEPYPTLTSSLQQSTAPAFAILESLVQAFTSLAQLVESTYMATHSSFFAMVGVADQLGSLKTYLGQVLGVFSLLRLGRRIVAWLRGKGGTASAAGAGLGANGWATEWATPSGAYGPPAATERPSSKPLILFLLSAVGLPYLMSRLVRLLIATTQSQSKNQPLAVGPNGEPLDASKLTFARARWEFRPTEEWELQLGRDEIVAVLEKRDGGWWRGRTRDGRNGWFPGNHVEEIKRSGGAGGGAPSRGEEAAKDQTNGNTGKFEPIT